MAGCEAKLPIILTIWSIANFVPHIVVFVLTRKVYYQLSPRSAVAAEASIMLLNLILPIALLLHSSPGCEVMQRLGWRWSGWRVVWAGSGGFIVSMFVLYIIRELIGEPISSQGQKYSPGELAMTITMLLTVTAFGEETMFRGYIQTELTERYGASVGIPMAAVLFGLRHLPMDLYNGITQKAPPSAWASRMLQLYLVALILGIARHWAGSTWASWTIHEGILIFIVVNILRGCR